MAQRLVLIDDLDESEGAETITYTVNGQDYEIDLSEENAQRFYDVLGPTLRKVGAFSVRLHQRHGEATGAGVAEADGMTSSRSAPGHSLKAWT
jgi:Lsr2